MVIAIIIICKKCKGAGKVEKEKLKIFKCKVLCKICKGKGKIDVSTANRNHRLN